MQSVCGRCEDEGRFVRLATPGPDQSGAPLFEHPLRLRPEEWRNLLGSISVQKRYEGFLFFPGQKGTPEAAFVPEDIDYLSAALSAAFDQVQPAEWVVFGLSRPASPEISEVTTGAWFVQDGQVHVRLANYRYAVSMQSVRELLLEHPLHGHEILYDVIPADHQTVRREGDGLPLFRTKPVELQIAYRAALAEPRSVQAVPGQQPTRQPQPPPDSATIEDRLRTLKRLREDGLLTEEEYRSKRRQVLEHF